MIGKEKDRTVERKKRRTRKYGQTKLKHSKKGIVSCFIAGGTFLLISILLSTAYVSKGQAGGVAGSIGIVATIFTCIGMVKAWKGFKEREKNYLTCKIGFGCNAFFFLGFVLIFLRGFI